MNHVAPWLIFPAMLTLRTHKISRLEEFSDAVFGFALTLLVLSSTVPRSYDQLAGLMRGLPAFACCFALLVWIWHEHQEVFERYPMADGRTILLNSVLLFVVLIYIYPLKFMFESFMGGGWSEQPPEPHRAHAPSRTGERSHHLRPGLLRAHGAVLGALSQCLQAADDAGPHAARSIRRAAPGRPPSRLSVCRSVRDAVRDPRAASACVPVPVIVCPDGARTRHLWESPWKTTTGIHRAHGRVR